MKNATNSIRAAVKRAVLLILLGLVAAAPALRGADANPPERMTYQGFLADANGVALGNSAPRNYNVVFRIYDNQSGGNNLWAEQQTLTVDKGYFSVLLGEGTQVGSEPHAALSTLFADNTASDRFVQITVKGIGAGGSDSTILPRLRLLTSPYALLAKKAISAVSLMNDTNRQVVSITGTSVGINQTSPTAALDVNGAARVSGILTVNGFTNEGASTLKGDVLVLDKFTAGRIYATNTLAFNAAGDAYLTVKNISGGMNPCINFDGNDWLAYLRAENEYDFRIATASKLRITSSNVVVEASGGLVAPNIVEKSDNRLGKGDVLLNLSVSTAGGSGSAVATKTLDNIKSTYRFVLIYAHTSVHDNTMLVHVDDLIAGQSYEMGKFENRYVVVKPPTSGTGTTWNVELGVVSATVKVRGLY